MGLSSSNDLYQYRYLSGQTLLDECNPWTKEQAEMHKAACGKYPVKQAKQSVPESVHALRSLVSKTKHL